MYRIFRGKTVYITVTLLLFTVILQIASGNMGTIGINTSEYDLHPNDLILTGMNAPFYIMKVTDNLLYFILPLIIIISASDFSFGTAKNILSNGTTRIKYYLSKLILAGLLCIFLALLNIITPIIAGTIINGFGGSLNAEFIINILKPFSLQLFLLLSASCVGIFLVFATKNSAAVIGSYIAVYLLPMILVLILSEIYDKFSKLIQYDVTMSIKMFSNFSAVTANDIIRTLLLGMFYILASTIGGIAIFNRSEIK